MVCIPEKALFVEAVAWNKIVEPKLCVLGSAWIRMGFQGCTCSIPLGLGHLVLIGRQGPLALCPRQHHGTKHSTSAFKHTKSGRVWPQNIPEHPRTTHHKFALIISCQVWAVWAPKVTTSTQHYLRMTGWPVRRLPTSRPARSLVAEAPPFGELVLVPRLDITVTA